MIDNRPKTHRRRHTAPKSGQEELPQPIPVTYHEPAPPPDVTPEKPAARNKKVGAHGIGGLLGNLGGLVGNLGGGLGGIGGILPIVLVIGALSGGSMLTGTKTRPALPPPKPETAPEPVAPEPQTGRKPRRALRTEAEPAAPPPPPPEPPQASPPPRPAPKPAEIKNLLGDLAGYLPGNGSASAAKISRIIGIADELRSLGGNEMFTASAPADPMNRHIGLLNVLSRNLPMSGAENLGRASQVLSLVNSLRGSGQGMGGLGNLGGMADMLRGAMSPQQSAPEMKNITPQQSDGIKDTVNRLLSGMDDKQKNELLDKAKNFLGKK